MYIRHYICIYAYQLETNNHETSQRRRLSSQTTIPADQMYSRDRTMRAVLFIHIATKKYT